MDGNISIEAIEYICQFCKTNNIPGKWKIIFLTIFILSIGKHYILNRLVPKFEPVHNSYSLVWAKNCWIRVANSEDPDQMPQNVASGLGLHCVLRPVYPILKG